MVRELLAGRGNVPQATPSLHMGTDVNAAATAQLQRILGVAPSGYGQQFWGQI